MKKISRYYLAAIVAATASCFTSCADHDIKSGNNNGNGGINGPLDPVEAYTRAFVKEFGEFKAKKWSEAVSGVISVRTSKPTPVNVFADIDGQRFIFASFGALNGLQPIMVHIPDGVEELIVAADGVEYKTKLGEVLDLSEGSRYAIEPVFVDQVASLGEGFKVNVFPNTRAMKIGGSALKDTWFTIKDTNYATAPGLFHVFDSDWNFTGALEDKQNHELYFGSHFYLGSNYTDFTVYPLYWRENIYGESDYMLGIYYFDINGFDFQGDRQVKMIDLEDVDIKQGISFKKSGTGEFTVSYSTKEAFDARNLANKDSVRFVGCHFNIDNICLPGNNNTNSRMGFYIKSGLKPGTTPGKGRNYTHITFQGNMLNGMEWGDNYWDVPLDQIHHSYDGAILCGSSPVKLAKHKPKRADGLDQTYDGIGTNDAIYNVIGFQCQPDGISTTPPDFSDVVLAITYRSATVGNQPVLAGETFGVYPWYLAAEDLGSTDDWDFNDLIVNVYDLTTDFTRPYVSSLGYYPTPSIMGRRITVIPRAAGGTYPIYLMYEGEVADAPTDETLVSAISPLFNDGTYVVGTELHAWLGAPDYTKMLNTGLNDGYTGGALSFCVPLMKDGTEEINPHDPPQICSGVNQGIRGFWVLVDKENKMRTELENTAFDITQLDPIYNKDRTQIERHRSQTKNVLKPFSGRLGEGAYRVDPPKESGSLAPQMLMCQYLWKWPIERANIGKAYSSFRDWVAGNRETWHNISATEGNNGYNPTLVCGEKAQAWIQ